MLLIDLLFASKISSSELVPIKVGTRINSPDSRSWYWFLVKIAPSCSTSITGKGLCQLKENVF